MTWAYFDPNQETYQEWVRLPDNWGNISNFYALENDLQYLKSHGWYPVVDDTVPLTNTLTQRYADPVYTLDKSAECVRKFCAVIESRLSVSISDMFAESRKSFLWALRHRRGELLKDSDWSQATDLQATRSDEWRNAWTAYRQQLRDLPFVYSQPPYESITDINLVQWPTVPE